MRVPHRMSDETMEIDGGSLAGSLKRGHEEKISSPGQFLKLLCERLCLILAVSDAQHLLPRTIFAKSKSKFMSVKPIKIHGCTLAEGLSHRRYMDSHLVSVRRFELFVDPLFLTLLVVIRHLGNGKPITTFSEVSLALCFLLPGDF